MCLVFGMMLKVSSIYMHIHAYAMLFIFAAKHFVLYVKASSCGDIFNVGNYIDC